MVRKKKAGGIVTRARSAISGMLGKRTTAKRNPRTTGSERRKR